MRSRIITILFCTASILALWAVASYEPVSLYTIDTPYEYPVVPGTPEWLSYATVIGRRKACQVPDEILEHMTTDALLLTALDYPFMSDIYAFNTMQMGYEAVKKHCNSLREFERRSDCLEALSRYCQSISSLDEEEKTLENYMAEHLYRIIADIKSAPQSA